MSCNLYDESRNKEYNQLAYPVDTNSLYGQHLYDSQTANMRAYKKNPISIFEGFGNSWVAQLIKIALFVLLVFLVISLVRDVWTPMKQVSLGLDTPSALELTQIDINGLPKAPVNNMQGGFL